MTYARRGKRFKDRSEIKWLDHEQRAAHRNTIKVLTNLLLTLEKIGRGATLTPEQEALVRSLTQSDAMDTRINAVDNMLLKTEAHYMQLLSDMGPHDLTAYHERMNPHEPPARHHVWLCEYLMKVESGELATLGVALPPGSAKSTYTSRSLAQWYMGRNPDKRVLAVGHSQKFAEDEFSKPNRNVLGSEDYQTVFPDVMLNPKEQGGSFWRLDGWRGSYTCRGALAGVSGVRTNLLLGDDLYKHAADALSEVVRGNIWRWFAADILSRRLPGAPIVLVNTRWHSADVVGALEKLAKENPAAIPQPAVFLNLPAEAEEDDPLGRKPGDWLWEEFYGATHYETLRSTMPPGLWSALYLGKPLDQHGDYVSEDDFQRFEEIPINRENEKPQWTRTIMSIDTAAKADERADYTAIGVFRTRVDGTRCLIDAWRGQKKLEDIIKIMSRLMRNWEVNYCIVENSGMGIQILENYQGKMPSPLVEYNPSGRGSKDFRFDAAAPWITTGKILFPKMAPWLPDLINECVAFPNGDYDDQVDMLSIYCDFELKTRRGGTKPLKMRG